MLEKKTTEMFDQQTITQIEQVKADYLAAESVFIDASKIADLRVVRKGNEVQWHE